MRTPCAGTTAVVPAAGLVAGVRVIRWRRRDDG